MQVKYKDKASAVVVKNETGGYRQKNLAPNKWNLIELEVYEEPVFHSLTVKIIRKDEAGDEWPSSPMKLFNEFELSPKSDYYSKKTFNVNFPSKNPSERAWIKDFTIIGAGSRFSD